MTETLPGTSSHHLEVTAWCAVAGPHHTRGALSTAGRGGGITAVADIENNINVCPDNLQLLLSHSVIQYSVVMCPVSAVLRKSRVRAAK